MYRRALALVLLVSVLVPVAPATDVDGDGLANLAEVRAGTEPFVHDTDHDGLADGYEAADALDPRSPDTDGDGLPDTAEVARGTDPRRSDTDADGVGDPREVDLGTDPSTTDTDGDGVADDRELAVGTDPTLADTDGDGLADGRELDVGTDPTLADTDGDGLADGPEVDRGTDPTRVDTDRDGFLDGWEVHRTDVLPDADPLRLDVYVELDAVTGASLPRAEAQRVVEQFAGAPVGRNGSRGIALHVVQNETGLTERGPVQISDRPGDGSVGIETYAADHFDRRGYGYHYALVVPEVLDVPGYEVLGEEGHGRILVQDVEVPDVRGATFMHELGHSLGLDRHDFDGIDSRRYPYSAYHSVMNNEAPDDYYGYATGEPFDDWAAIEGGLYVPDASRFDETASG